MHIIKNNNKKTPSAFIPFCDFGGKMTHLGLKIKEFDIPVCQSFRATILNDQLCYEVDLNMFANKENIEDELGVGFNFLMDYNEDRQVTVEGTMKENKFGLASSIIQSDESHHAFIYLNTLRKITWE